MSGSGTSTIARQRSSLQGVLYPTGTADWGHVCWSLQHQSLKHGPSIGVLTVVLQNSAV